MGLPKKLPGHYETTSRLVTLSELEDNLVESSCSKMCWHRSHKLNRGFCSHEEKMRGNSTVGLDNYWARFAEHPPKQTLNNQNLLSVGCLFFGGTPHLSTELQSAEQEKKN